MTNDPSGSRFSMLTAQFRIEPPVAIEPLGSAGVNNAVWLVRTGAGEFIWKLIRTGADPASLRYEHRLLGELARQSPPFALPMPVPTRAGATYALLPDGAPGVLLPRLPGRQIARHDPEEIALLGEASGMMVGALARLPARPHPVLASYGDLARVHPRLPDPFTLAPADLGLPATAALAALCDWWRSALVTVAAFLAGPYRALPRQMAHCDFGPGNALIDDGRVVAVLDFEFAQPEVRAIDVAAPLVHVMRLWERETAAALTMAAVFCRGFRRAATLSDAEIAALPDLMFLRDVVSTIWWLGRDLDAGIPPDISRLTDLREFASWLGAHEDELRGVVEAALG